MVCWNHICCEVRSRAKYSFPKLCPCCIQQIVKNHIQTTAQNRIHYVSIGAGPYPLLLGLRRCCTQQWLPILPLKFMNTWSSRGMNSSVQHDWLTWFIYNFLQARSLFICPHTHRTTTRSSRRSIQSKHGFDDMKRRQRGQRYAHGWFTRQ